MTHPTEVDPEQHLTLSEVWIAMGGNPGIKPTKSVVIENLKLLDEVCEQCGECPAKIRPSDSGDTAPGNTNSTTTFSSPDCNTDNTADADDYEEEDLVCWRCGDMNACVSCGVEDCGLTLSEVEYQEKRITELKEKVDFYRRRCDALQLAQASMRDPERTIVCDILANGALAQGPWGLNRYTVPPDAKN